MDSKYSPLKKPTKCLKNALFRWKRGGQICQKNKPKNLNRKDRKETEYKLDSLSFFSSFALRRRSKKQRISTAKTQRPRRSRIQVRILCFSCLPLRSLRLCGENAYQWQRPRRSRIQVVFLSALSVLAVRMLWFKKHIQQQEN